MKIRIDGAEEISKTLKSLGARIERNVMRGAVRASAKAYAGAVRRNVRKLNISRTAKSRLRKAIKYKEATKKGKNPYAFVEITRNPRPRVTKTGKNKGKATFVNDPKIWAKWFEDGTRPRFRGGKETKRIRLMRERTGDRRGYTGRIRPQPFIKPAYEASTMDAIAAAIDYTKKRLEKEVKKAAEKGKGKA